MLRRLVLGVLVLSLVFSLIFGSVPVSFSQKKYNEAPMLAELVKAGKLPPVEQRLPEEPLVLEPTEQIGEYGGTIRVAYPTVYRWIDVSSITNWPTVLRVSSKDYHTLLPNVARSWKFSGDRKTLTLYFRKGMKWSDGHPFTADDIMFWYEDVLLNKELTPVFPTWLAPGGKPAKIEKIDDYTIKIVFSVSYPIILHNLAMQMIYLPKHYLKQYHPRYTSEKDLEKMVKEKGFSHWRDLFGSKSALGPTDATREVDAPTLSAYVVKSRTTNVVILERNPYYWKIDTAGNQLPYIDRIQASLVENVEMYNMKIIMGELDYADYNTSLENYPLYKESSDKGGYRVLLWPTIYTSGVAFMPNLNHKDPVLRRVLNDKRFRRALSLAINRDEINNLVYLGLGVPMQTTVLPPSPLYKEEYAKAYIKYDPKEANRLLDEMKLKWDKDRKYRLRPDGKTLSLTIEFPPGEMGTIRNTTCELVQKYWEAIGIKVALKPEASELFMRRVGAAEHDISLWQVLTPEIRLYWLPRDYVPTQTVWSQWGTLWALWYSTGGKSGEEPPPEIKRLYKLWEIASTAIDEKVRLDALDKILKSQAENLWTISTVGQFPQPIIINKKLANVPEKLYWGWDYGYASIGNPETWFFKK